MDCGSLELAGYCGLMPEMQRNEIFRKRLGVLRRAQIFCRPLAVWKVSKVGLWPTHLPMLFGLIVGTIDCAGMVMMAVI